jgi:hypothetical protein
LKGALDISSAPFNCASARIDFHPRKFAASFRVLAILKTLPQVFLLAVPLVHQAAERAGRNDSHFNQHLRCIVPCACSICGTTAGTIAFPYSYKQAAHRSRRHGNGDAQLAAKLRRRDQSCQCRCADMAGRLLGDCGGTPVQANYMESQNLEALKRYAANYTPFEAVTPAGKVVFNGKGSTPSTPAEQRMIAELANLMVLEGSYGRSGVSWGHAISFRREGASPMCIDVLATGEMYVSTCLPNHAGVITRLNPGELGKRFRWIDGFASFEYVTESPAKMTLLFTGRDTQQVSNEDNKALRSFVESLDRPLNTAQHAPA